MFVGFTGLCDAGFFCRESAYTSSPPDGPNGGLCPVGGYCPEGSATPQPCEAGYYVPSQGSKSPTDCIPCEPGKYCAGTQGSAATGESYICSKLLSDLKRFAFFSLYFLLYTYSVLVVGLHLAGYICWYLFVGTKYVLVFVVCCVVDLCFAGYYCDGGSSVGTQHEAPAGHYTVEGDWAARPCPVETYQGKYVHA